jgi:hypothetical protein
MFTLTPRRPKLEGEAVSQSDKGLDCVVIDDIPQSAFTLAQQGFNSSHVAILTGKEQLLLLSHGLWNPAIEQSQPTWWMDARIRSSVFSLSEKLPVMAVKLYRPYT